MFPKDCRQIAKRLPCHQRENITIIKAGALYHQIPHGDGIFRFQLHFGGNFLNRFIEPLIVWAL